MAKEIHVLEPEKNWPKHIVFGVAFGDDEQVFKIYVSNQNFFTEEKRAIDDLSVSVEIFKLHSSIGDDGMKIETVRTPFTLVCPLGRWTVYEATKGKYKIVEGNG